MTRQHTFLLKFRKFTEVFAGNVMTRQHKLAKHLQRLKIEKKHLSLNLFNNLSSADEIVITWEWECLHLKIPIRCLFKSLGVNCTCHQLHVSWCLGLNWQPIRSIEPPRSLGTSSHPWQYCVLVFWSGTAWSAVDCSQRAAAALSSLDQHYAAWCLVGSLGDRPPGTAPFKADCWTVSEEWKTTLQYSNLDLMYCIWSGITRMDIPI